MKHRFGILALLLAGILLLSGCRERRGAALVQAPSETAPPPAAQAAEPAGEASRLPAAETVPAGPGYIDSLVQETVSRILQPGMGEFERAKAAFDYMIENITLVDPVGLDIWRIRGRYDTPPPFVENRSLSVLAFGVGKCEDYAAALTMLLRGMGLEAVYVPGLTYSSQGALVDHAWTVARIDGVWYHLDCQLEQNISRHGSIRYKYFMKGDATMAGSHRWGQNLIDSGLLSAAQNEEIARDFQLPACPQDHPAPARHTFTKAEAPDMTALQAAIAEEFLLYERDHGPLEPLELNIIPPVFALEGYGPQD